MSCYGGITHLFISVIMQRAWDTLSDMDSMVRGIQSLRTWFKHHIVPQKRILVAKIGGTADSYKEWGNTTGLVLLFWRKSVHCAPLFKLDLHITDCGFIDDTYIIQTGLEWNDNWTMTSKLQEVLQWWEVCTKIFGTRRDKYNN